MIPFRISTYNVHKCKGMDWKVRPARIAEVLACLRADMIATQEILLSQAAEISERIELPFVFGCAREHAGEPYGNAVFSRWPILSQQSYDLTVPGRERRQCLRVSFQLPSGTTAHLLRCSPGNVLPGASETSTSASFARRLTVAGNKRTAHHCR